MKEKKYMVTKLATEECKSGRADKFYKFKQGKEIPGLLLVMLWVLSTTFKQSSLLNQIIRQECDEKECDLDILVLRHEGRHRWFL